MKVQSEAKEIGMSKDSTDGGLTMTDSTSDPSRLRDFADFLPENKREDFNATIDDLFESAPQEPTQHTVSPVSDSPTPAGAAPFLDAADEFPEWFRAAPNNAAPRSGGQCKTSPDSQESPAAGHCEVAAPFAEQHERGTYVVPVPRKPLNLSAPSAPCVVVQRDFLEVARCPNCEGQGWYVVPNRNTGEPEQQQCEWCYLKASYLSAAPSVRCSAT